MTTNFIVTLYAIGADLLRAFPCTSFHVASAVTVICSSHLTASCRLDEINYRPPSGSTELGQKSTVRYAAFVYSFIIIHNYWQYLTISAFCQRTPSPICSWKALPRAEAIECAHHIRRKSLLFYTARIESAAGSMKLSSVRLSVRLSVPSFCRRGGFAAVGPAAGDIDRQRRPPGAEQHGARQQTRSWARTCWFLHQSTLYSICRATDYLRNRRSSFYRQNETRDYLQQIACSAESTEYRKTATCQSNVATTITTITYNYVIYDYGTVEPERCHSAA